MKVKTNKVTVPVKPKKVIGRMNADGKVSLINLERNQYFYTLDGLAAQAWTMINGKNSAACIAEKLAKKHKIKISQLKTPIAKLLRDLENAELIYLK